MKLASRITIGLICVALSLFLIQISLTISASNTNYYRSLSILVNPSDGLRHSTNDLIRAKSTIDKAREYLPSDPDNLTTAGRIDYLLALNSNIPEKRRQLLESSKKIHLQALKQRPFWAYSEINILFVMHLLKDYSEEYQERYSRVTALAPEDKKAIIDLAEITILSWSMLSLDNQQSALTLLEKVLVHEFISTRELRESMRLQGDFYQICAQLNQFPKKRELCNS